MARVFETALGENVEHPQLPASSILLVASAASEWCSNGVPSLDRVSTLRTKFKYVSNAGLDLLSCLLTYDPTQRITAEEAMEHPYFK